ncbi:hypothetical protein HPB51_006794 [Rhipicephalus microplus]|uniref:Uncharacterized protein n=1 Tax=Rhipicephalus microplus TaxID=6941 RepID=A0A9J6E7V2_RHIMP|nr:hypothetical protein HPB51_006794 [Rhipicephalus microplus]
MSKMAEELRSPRDRSPRLSPIQDPESAKNLWYAVVGRATITALAYPIEYVKFLVQIGHEPLPPKPTRRLFGKPALALPGAIEYMKYIKKVDGYSGLYRGLSVRLCANVVSGAVFAEVNRRLPEVQSFDDEEDDDTVTEEQRIVNFVKRTLKLMTAKCAALFVSQPFNVVCCRYMAQFVGREEKYVGLIPRLIGEVLTIWFASTISFVINAYVVQDKGQLKRGSSIIWRYYQGSYIIDENGVPRPVSSHKLLASH